MKGDKKISRNYTNPKKEKKPKNPKKKSRKTYSWEREQKGEKRRVVTHQI